MYKRQKYTFRFEQCVLTSLIGSTAADGSREYARRKGCHAVCCGHTHLPAALTDGPVHYFNSGSWTEKPCHYLTVRDGGVEVHAYDEPATELVAQGVHRHHVGVEREAAVLADREHELVDGGVFVDLLVVARNAVQVGVEGYGLKHLERLTDYERSHEIDQGAGAVVAFEQYQKDGDQAHLDAIAAYNLSLIHI